MTIREKLLKFLNDHGLLEEEAKEVLKLYIRSPMGGPMIGRMDDKIDDYPPAIIAAAWMGVSASAVKWIDKNKPQHWARPMFAPK